MNRLIGVLVRERDKKEVLYYLVHTTLTGLTSLKTSGIYLEVEGKDCWGIAVSYPEFSKRVSLLPYRAWLALAGVITGDCSWERKPEANVLEAMERLALKYKKLPKPPRDTSEDRKKNKRKALRLRIRRAKAELAADSVIYIWDKG